MVRISRDRMDMEDGRVDRAAFKKWGEVLVGGASGTNTGSSYTININNGNVYNLILNANCAFTFSNPTGSGAACSFTVFLKQDATGSRTVTWPAAVRWSGATIPTLTGTANSIDVFSFFTTNGGTTWYGSMSGQMTGPPAELFLLDYDGRETNASSFTFSFTDFTVTGYHLIAYQLQQSGGGAPVDPTITIDNGGGPVSCSSLITAATTTERVGIHISDTPFSGATAEVIVNEGSTQTQCEVAVYVAIDLQTPSAAFDTLTSTANPPSGTISCPAGGFMLAISQVVGAGDSFVWTGLDSDGFDIDNSGDECTTSLAHKNFSAEQTNLTVTADPTGTTRPVLAAVAMR